MPKAKKKRTKPIAVHGPEPISLLAPPDLGDLLVEIRDAIDDGFNALCALLNDKLNNGKAETETAELQTSAESEAPTGTEAAAPDNPQF